MFLSLNLYCDTIYLNLFFKRTKFICTSIYLYNFNKILRIYTFLSHVNIRNFKVFERFEIFSHELYVHYTFANRLSRWLMVEEKFN